MCIEKKLWVSLICLTVLEKEFSTQVEFSDYLIISSIAHKT